MFRRKDEDVAQDLLSEADSANITTQPTSQNSEPEPSYTAATTTSTADSQQGASGANTGFTRSESANRAPSSANPAGAPYRQPVDYNRNRMQDFRNPVKAPAAASASSADKNKSGNRRVLTVGHDILLKGEIATCDRLVIEGEVDATLNEVHTVEIAEGGSFKGTAQIEDAEISGLFEGELVVRNRLVIYSTGKVRGKITYGEIEIERGGELTGEIRIENQHASQNAGKREAA